MVIFEEQNEIKLVNGNRCLHFMQTESTSNANADTTCQKRYVIESMRWISERVLYRRSLHIAYHDTKNFFNISIFGPLKVDLPLLLRLVFGATLTFVSVEFHGKWDKKNSNKNINTIGANGRVSVGFVRLRFGLELSFFCVMLMLHLFPHSTTVIAFQKLAPSGHCWYLIHFASDA